MTVDVAAGLTFTVAATIHGRVFQMGEMGTSKPAKWEGSRIPEQVGASQWDAMGSPS